jgi:hypothetical protein
LAASKLRVAMTVVVVVVVAVVLNSLFHPPS